MLPRTEALIDRALASLQDFLRLEAAGGLLLMGAAMPCGIGFTLRLQLRER